jgi:hypothetical protein
MVLELQPSVTSAVSKGGHSSVVAVSTAIEHYFRHAGGFRALG